MNINEHKFKILVAMGCFFVLALFFSLPLSFGKIEKSPVKVRVGIFQNKPIVYQDESGKPQGLYVDLLNEIALHQNWQLEFIHSSFFDCLEGLKENKIDLVTSIAYTKERDLQMDFSNEIVCTLWGTVYANVGSRINTIFDLNGKKVAIMKKGIFGKKFRQLCRDFNVTCVFVETESQHDSLNLLRLNNVEAAIFNNAFREVYTALKFAKKTSIVYSPLNIQFATSKSNNHAILEAIDSELREMKKDKDSLYYESLNKWLSVREVPKKFIPKWLIYTFIIFCIVLVSSLIWTSLLFFHIRKRKKVEAALQESEEKYQNLVMNSYDIVYSMTPDGIITFIGPQIERFEYDTGDLISKPFIEFVAPEQRQKVLSSFEKGIKDDTNFPTEFQLIRKDGKHHWVEAVGNTSYDESGNPLHQIGVLRDIDERKHAEREALILRTAVDQVPVGIALADKNLNLYLCNPEGLGLRGGDEGDLVEIPKDAFDNWQVLMLNGEPYEIDNLPLVRAVTKGQTIREEFIVRHQDGSDHICDATASPIYDDKEIIGGIVIFPDVTERRQIEDKIKASLKEKELLLQEVHHRVKNNMQLIVSLLSLQQQHIGSNDTEQLKDVISRVRIFGDIHRKLYQQEDISRIDFVNYLKENLQGLITAYNVDNKKIELVLDIANPIFNLDQAISCGLLMNELISNSLKHAFTDKGKINISITHDTVGELKRIVYADNGKGIEPLNEGFGTKIINALAKQLDLIVHISAKEGTRFDFTRKGKDQIIEKSSGEILYVEDEVIIAMDKVAYLKENGYSVNESIITSGEKAVKYVRESNSKPSLILMDIGLKGEMNGIEAAQEIRKDNPSIPIIFLSGYEDTKTQKTLSAIPNTSFLNKLSTPEEMEEIIESHQIFKKFESEIDDLI